MAAAPRVFENISDVDLRGGPPVAMTIGTFDGVHMAHQELMRLALEKAREIGGIAVSLTFRNHPRAIVSPDNVPPLLTVWERKRRLILERGIDILVGHLFSAEFARTPAPDFIRDVIAGRFAARIVISGPGFHFGHMGQGNSELLRAMSGELGYTYIRRDPVMYDGEKVSSTRIRGALAEGDVALAAKLLTRPHTNDGSVGSGDRLGRTIGFPTANLDIDPRTLVPADGVYAVRVHLEDGAVWPGMMNIGWRPTVGGKSHRKEVHLIGFSGELEGTSLSVEYIQRLRGEKKFDGLDGLKAQLAQDKDHAEEVLGNQRS